MRGEETRGELIYCTYSTYQNALSVTDPSKHF